MSRTLRRLGVASLPALLLLASLAALLMSIPAWGAGNGAGLSAWMPTAAGIVIGLPGAVIAGLCLRSVLRGTRAAFGVTPLLLLFGLLALPIAIATETAVAVGVANPATYNRLVEPDSAPSPSAGAQLPSGPVSPAGFMAGTALIALFLNGVVAVSAVVYASAINVDGGLRFERQPNEFDAVAELLKGRHGPHTPLP